MYKLRKTISDEDLLVLVKQGQESANRELYKRCNFLMIKKMIIENGGNTDDAKDLFQEAFIVLYKNIRNDKFKLNGKFSTYIYSVAKKLWYKRFNAQKNIVFDGLVSIKKDTEGNLFDTKIEKQYKKYKVEKMLRYATEKCKKLLHAFYIEGWSMDTIAIRFNYSSAKVAKQTKYKCLDNIKKHLKK